MFDTIVVGGGITGLQLGALLANDGEKVLLLEKSARLGGRAAVVKKKGFEVDYGIHLIRFGPNSAISQTCRQLGHEVEYAQLGTSWVMDVDGKLKVFPTGPKAFLTTRLLSFGERIKAARLIGKIRRGAHSQELKEKSVEEWMDENKVTGGLRRYFHLVSASMMVCPFIERTSVGEMFANMQKVLQTGISVMYPRGGWLPLIELFKSKIEESGEIRLQSPVKSLKVEEGKVKGVNLAEGELIPAAKVVLSMPSFEILDLLPERVDNDFKEKCKRNSPTAGIVLDYGLKEPVSDISGLCYMYNPMSFGMFTSNVEPKLAPEGKQLLTWLQPVDNKKIKEKQWANRQCDELEKSLFRFFPRLESAIEWRRALYLPVVDGTEVNVEQIEEKRPSAVVPGVDNLFLVGDSIAAPGAGGDVGHESVHVTYAEMKEAKKD